VKVSVTVERIKAGDLAWCVLVDGREALSGLVRTDAYGSACAG
jgi:hypothetical protein